MAGEHFDSRDDVWPDIVFGTLHDVFQNPAAQAALRAYQNGVHDPEIIEMIRAPVRKARVRAELELDVPFRKPQLFHQELLLGADSDQDPVGILRAWFNAGILMVANTGGGKTNFLKFLLLQIAAFVAGLWVSDLYKQDIRHLRPLLRRLGIEFIVAPARALKLNLLQADCDPRTYLSIATDILCRVLDLPPRAMSIVRAVCHQLYKEFGIYSGKRDHWPTLFDLYERIRATKGLNAQAREAILDRLGSLLVSVTPAVAAYRLAWKPSELAKFHINFEMRGVSEHVKSMLLSQLLFSVLYSRVEEGASNAQLDLCVAFEDSQRFFSGKTTTGGDMPPTDEVAGLIRGMGVSLWGACQSMSGLSKGLLPNLATKIMGRLGTHEDYQRLGADMGMNAKQLAWARVNLRPGVFVVQVAEGPWRRPFVVNVPKLTIPYVVDEAEVAASVRTLEVLPTIPAPEFATWEPSHVINISTQHVTQPQSAENSGGLSEAERRFLAAVLRHPGKSASAYAKLAGMGQKRAIPIRKSLLELGFLREHTVATGQRGRNAIILEPTKKAKSALSDDPCTGEVCE